jgi:hypothetical protein
MTVIRRSAAEQAGELFGHRRRAHAVVHGQVWNYRRLGQG